MLAGAKKILLEEMPGNKKLDQVHLACRTQLLLPGLVAVVHHVRPPCHMGMIYLISLTPMLLRNIALDGLYWAVLGCAGLLWAVLGCTGQYWAVLGCIGLYWTVLGCTGL